MTQSNNIHLQPQRKDYASHDRDVQLLNSYSYKVERIHKRCNINKDCNENFGHLIQPAKLKIIQTACKGVTTSIRLAKQRSGSY